MTENKQDSRTCLYNEIKKGAFSHFLVKKSGESIHFWGQFPWKSILLRSLP